MFDFGWWELAFVAVLMILVLGPKELPHAMRSIARFMRKARRLASEFQGHMDDLIREAELDEVKNTVRSIKNQDMNKLINETVDPGGELTKELNETTKELNDTMADARREMNDIKTAAGPSPTASVSAPEKQTESKPPTIPGPELKPSESESAKPASEPADTPPAAAGPA